MISNFLLQNKLHNHTGHSLRNTRSAPSLHRRSTASVHPINPVPAPVAPSLTPAMNPNSGPLIQRELKEGETLRVSSGSVVAFSTSVQYDVQTVPGFKNVVFGGEGLFITKLTG